MNLRGDFVSTALHACEEQHERSQRSLSMSSSRIAALALPRWPATFRLLTASKGKNELLLKSGCAVSRWASVLQQRKPQPPHGLVRPH